MERPDQQGPAFSGSPAYAAAHRRRRLNLQVGILGPGLYRSREPFLDRGISLELQLPVVEACIFIAKAFKHFAYPACGNQGNVGAGEQFFDLFNGQRTSVEADLRHFHVSAAENPEDFPEIPVLYAETDHYFRYLLKNSHTTSPVSMSSTPQECFPWTMT